MNFKFPLLKLPLLGIEAVVKSLEICGIIHLSLTSKRLIRLIKASRLKMNRFMYVVTNNHTSIKFNFESPDTRGGWTFSRYRKIGPVTTWIDGMEVSSFIHNNWLFSNMNRNLEESVKIQMDYLKSLIRFPIPDVEIRTDSLLERKHPLLIGINECRNLTVHGEKELEETYMKELLQSCFLIRNILHIRVATPRTYTHDISKWKLPKKIYILKTSHWITIDVLLHSNCSHMHFMDCNLTAGDFIQFVKRWLNSDETNFEFLCLSWKNGIPQDLNLDNLGVELNEFDPETRNRCFPVTTNPGKPLQVYRHAMDMSAGRDFIRKNGVLASIAIVGRKVAFCVFHERFPNMDGRKVRPP